MSFLAQVHPTTRVLCLLGSFVPPFLGDGVLDLLPWLLLLGLGIRDAGAWPGVRRLLPLMGILLVMSLVLWTLFRPQGPLLWTWGPLAVHRDGLLYGLTTGVRLCCFVLSALIMLACTHSEQLTRALARLGLPWAMSFALSLAFRLTPLFLETGQTILQAQRARGLDLEGAGPWQRIRRTAPVIVPILVSGLRRADQLAIALEARGFGHPGPRSSLDLHPVTWRDGVLPLILLLGGLLVALGPG